MTPEPTRAERSASIADKLDRDPVLRPNTWFVAAFALILAGAAVAFLSFVVADRALLLLAAWLIAAGNLLGGLGFAIASVQLLIRITPRRPQFSLRSLLAAAAVFAYLCSVGATCGWPALGGLTAAALQLLAPVVVVLSSRRRPGILQAALTGVIVAVVASFGVSAFCGATIGSPRLMVGWLGPSLRAAFYGPVDVLIVAGQYGWPYCVVVAVGALEGVICSKVHGRFHELSRRPRTWFLVAFLLMLAGCVAIPLLKNWRFESWAMSYPHGRLFDLLAAGLVAAGIASGAVGFVIRHRLRKM